MLQVTSWEVTREVHGKRGREGICTQGGFTHLRKPPMFSIPQLRSKFAWGGMSRKGGYSTGRTGLVRLCLRFNPCRKCSEAAAVVIYSLTYCFAIMAAAVGVCLTSNNWLPPAASQTLAMLSLPTDINRRLSPDHEQSRTLPSCACGWRGEAGTLTSMGVE